MKTSTITRTFPASISRGRSRMCAAACKKQIFNFTVAEKDGEAVGCYFLHAVDGRAELEDFYVFEPHRGKGIGTQMLRDCQAKANGALWLRIFAGNVRAIGFYIRLGFHIRGEAGGWHAVDAVHLKILPATPRAGNTPARASLCLDHFFITNMSC